MIKSVLKEKNINFDNTGDPLIRKIRRRFNRLLEVLGVNAELLKLGKKDFLFEGMQIPITRAVITQLCDNNSLLTNFSEKRGSISIEDIESLINTYVSEAEKSGLENDECYCIATWLRSIMNLNARYIWHNCNKLLIKIENTTNDLRNEEKIHVAYSMYLLIMDEYQRRSGEVAINAVQVAEDIEASKKELKNDIGNQYYTNPPQPDMIRYENMQRDIYLYNYIIEDKGLREYIENKLGKKIEEIYNVAASDM